VARSKRPTGNGIRLDGLRAELRSALVGQVERGDPRYLGDWGPELSSQERREANEASPAIRQARRKIDAIDRGVGIVCGCPHPRGWPELANVPQVADRSLKRVFVDKHDNIRPVWTPRHTVPHDPDAEVDEMIQRRLDALAAEVADIFAELELPVQEVCWI
jgi:hypothetical protein